jgi:NAD-dependent deacetylase
VLEVHGTLATTRCVRCGLRAATLDVLARARGGETDPRCLSRGGILRPDAVFFGDIPARSTFGHAVALARGCGLLLAVGTSLRVRTAANLCAAAIESGADLIVVNAGATSYDDLAVAVVRGPIGETLPRLVGALIGRTGRPGRP